MNTTKKQKISRLIQKTMGEYFQQNARILLGNTMMVTVTVVRLSPDSGVAKVYLSLFGSSDKEKAMEVIRAKAKEIRRELGVKVKNQIRIIPELIFYIDDSLDYAEKIDSLLKH
ncbi:MAG: ribosome-binding factor A [Bacteroidetes bacterium RIFCSPLOWO2_12_FULL_31_6]|nr:MAG: ribosome-binding factor A [Bacteroidetes bacterium RIFCSPLOWO2_12_FULL_31_6]